MRHIFILATEHHLMQFYHAIKYFKLLDKNIYLILIKGNNNNLWVNDIKDSDLYAKVFVVENWVFKDLIINRFKIKAFLNIIYELKDDLAVTLYTSQYFIDASNIAFNILNPAMYYVLDEGTASFLVNIRRKNKRLNLKLIVKSLLYLTNLQYPKSVTFFTQYYLDVKKSDSVIQYNIECDNYIKKVQIKDTAILLGSSIVEVGAMKGSVYLNLIKKIKKDLTNKKCLYYAHRHEDETKLDIIKKFGFEVKVNNMPFEFVYDNFIEIPEILCSFASPILDNISKKYTYLPKLIIYKFEIKDIRKNRQVIIEIYNSYKKNNKLKIVDL